MVHKIFVVKFTYGAGKKTAMTSKGNFDNSRLSVIASTANTSVEPFVYITAL